MHINSSMMAAYDSFLDRLYLDQQEELERFQEEEEAMEIWNRTDSELVEELTRHVLDASFWEEERMFAIANELKFRKNYSWGS